MFELKPIVRHLLRACGGVGALVLVGSAVAQDKPQVEETVVITGTRIRTPGVTSNSPISSVGEEEIKAGQPVVVEEFFKGLPAAVPAIGSGTNNGTEGGATIDLRGLGANRSLVLIDGRRVVPFNLEGAVDTNAIPIALLQRVDLVTGGASAVYGADAVAGVANFILRRDFRGFEASTSYGMSDENDAKRKRTDITMGAGLDNGRGNVALSVGFTKTNPLRQDARPFGVASLDSEDGTATGSFTSVPLVEANLFQQMDPATGTFVGDPNTGDGINTFNFNPDNYYQTPLKRTQVTALGHYTINQYVEPYALLMFTRTDVGSQLAPSGTFFNDYFVPLGNPFLPAPARQQICTAFGLTAAQCADNNREVLLSLGRRFVELGPRLNDFKNTMFQTTLGLRGDVIGSWQYDVYHSVGRSDQVQTRENWGSSSKVQQALRAQSATACTDTSNGCVPLNIFGAAGTITPAMLSFINLDAVLLQEVEQRVTSGSVTGDLGRLKSPLANLPIGVAVGAEYRAITAGNKSDGPTQIAGEVLGTGAALPDHRGKFTLQEIFAELSVPLVTDKPFARRLALETGYRNTKFNAGSPDSYGSYKYGGEWEPLQGLRFRAMAQRATRAPNVDELFLPVITQLDNLAADPCQGTNITAAQANTPGTLSNLCLLTGVPLAQFGTLPSPTAGQVNILQGGNPNLGPETADTKTLGLVFQPTFARGLTVTADYYDIKITGAISNPSVSDVMDDCYTAARNPGLTFNASCAQVLRNPNNGTFNGVASPGVVLPLTNSGMIRTSGYDFNIVYGFAFRDWGLAAGLGRLDIGFNVNYVEKYEFQATPLSVKRDCLGYYSVACGTNSEGQGPVHQTKWSQRTAWSVGDFILSYVWRHVSAVDEEPGGTNFLPAFASIPAYDWVDLAFVWKVNKNARVNFTVNNLLDKGPPVVGNTIGTTTSNSGNTFPQSYDVIGRFYTLGATLNF